MGEYLAGIWLVSVSFEKNSPGTTFSEELVPSNGLCLAFAIAGKSFYSNKSKFNNLKKKFIKNILYIDIYTSKSKSLTTSCTRLLFLTGVALNALIAIIVKKMRINLNVFD